MTSPTPPPLDVKPVDPDIAEQAVPGHGVPSQDPDAAAQVGLSPEEAARESKSALIGGGLVAGLAAGAAVGAVAGPVGVVVGGTVGAAVGVAGSNAVGASVNPKSTGGPVKGPKKA
jgi:phage tail tape-measure protein